MKNVAFTLYLFSAKVRNYSLGLSLFETNFSPPNSNVAFKAPERMESSKLIVFYFQPVIQQFNCMFLQSKCATWLIFPKNHVIKHVSQSKTPNHLSTAVRYNELTSFMLTAQSPSFTDKEQSFLYLSAFSETTFLL